MSFEDPTLYGRDDDTDEYSDSSAYGESVEEDLEEEEEEEEEPIISGEDEEEEMDDDAGEASGE
jgi:hypothetical protein